MAPDWRSIGDYAHLYRADRSMERRVFVDADGEMLIIPQRGALRVCSELGRLARAYRVRINSSHHQSIANPGERLKVTARGADGIVEAVEFDSPEDWVIGVQWHPERMPGDAFAEKLFADFVGAARKAKLLTAGR